jgi:hypothetical protein
MPRGVAPWGIGCKQKRRLLASICCLRHPCPVDTRAIYIGLIGWQLAAVGGQVAVGFVPFVESPGRVAGSWDMFAPCIERCDIGWEPAVNVGGRSIRFLHELAAPLEFFFVQSRVDAYRQLAAALATEPTHVQLHCFLPAGKTFSEAFDVP